MPITTEWRKVPIGGFEEYEVSNEGQIRSRKTGHCRLLKPKDNRHTGYRYVCLYNSNQYITRSIHRLVALAFIPNPDNKSQVNHINEDKHDNRVENLEWVTPYENNVHSKYRRYKQVELYSVDGELLGTFTSERALCEVLGISKSAVSQALKLRNHTCDGFIIKYAEEVS